MRTARHQTSSLRMPQNEEKQRNFGVTRNEKPSFYMGSRGRDGTTADDHNTSTLRGVRPVSPPQKLAQRLESEVNPLDFLGGELRDGEKNRHLSKRRSARVVVTQDDSSCRGELRSGASVKATGKRATSSLAKAAAPEGAAPTSSSACDVALMLVEKMGRRDLERVMAEAGRRLLGLSGSRSCRSQRMLTGALAAFDERIKSSEAREFEL